MVPVFHRSYLITASVIFLITNSYGVAYSNAHFGQGSGPITIDELQCNGYESSIRQCSSEPWHTHNCNHGEDAGVHCSGNITFLNNQ